ncbi:MAG: hypothetical protein CVU54_06860 [Deltaproteobacteria bacterium HGW-Deltaproteobacteria-12]|jgi:hypothetical protein|nr:MAG: hypothetical protein CVU54_06860 [Deltaproteobacteria bacterium HGW-Deltaproteobacteria-12]
MTYPDKEGKVIYTAKDKKTSKSFAALEWLAAMCTYIPNRGEQMVRYNGYYSNVARGKRKAKGTEDIISCILEPEENSKAFRKNRVRLIQKIYEVDPLICPKCKGAMRIIGFIEDPSVIRKSLCIWKSGLSDHDRRPKSVPPSHCTNPKPPIPARILHINKPTVTPTLNMNGKITFNPDVTTHSKT